MTTEIVYVNNGNTYKTSEKVSDGGDKIATSIGVDGLKTVYKNTNTVTDPYISFYAEKTNNEGNTSIKTYRSTQQLVSLLERNGGEDISEYNLATEVNLWCAIGTVDSRPNEVELYFNVESYEQMAGVANHYGLANPFATDTDFNNNRLPWIIAQVKTPSTGLLVNIVMGSIVLEYGQPSRLKVYKANVPS